MRRTTTARTAASVLAVAMLAAACGGDEEADDASSAATEAEGTDAEDTDAEDTGAEDSGDDAEPTEDEATEDDTDTSGGALTDACSSALTTEGTLTVATGEPVFEPWMVDDDPTNEQGFESALVYALADELGVDTVEWIRTGFDEAIAPGAKGYDFNIQQYSINADRDEVVDFSDGYYEVEQAIIGASDGDIASATSLAELAEYRLGAAIGTTSLTYVEEQITPGSDALVFNDNAASKAAFDANQVDGIVYDLPTAYFITAVEITDASIIGVLPRVGDEPEELGMLFEEGSELVSCVNDGLAALRDAGTIEALEDEWLNQGGDIPTLTADGEDG